jgi:hypothetical protein
MFTELFFKFFIACNFVKKLVHFCALSPPLLTCYTIEFAAAVEESLSAVARNTGTDARHLVIHTGLMLNTARDICPCSVLLRRHFLLYMGENEKSADSIEF